MCFGQCAHEFFVFCPSVQTLLVFSALVTLVGVAEEKTLKLKFDSVKDGMVFDFTVKYLM